MIASKVVVTAAQCCENIQDKNKALVSAGSLKPLSKEAHVRDVFKVGKFATSTKDICILILEEELPTQGDIVSFVNIETPKRHYNYSKSKQCRIVGWNSGIELAYENVTTHFCNTNSATTTLCTNSQVLFL